MSNRQQKGIPRGRYRTIRSTQTSELSNRQHKSFTRGSFWIAGISTALELSKMAARQVSVPRHWIIVSLILRRLSNHRHLALPAAPPPPGASSRATTWRFTPRTQCVPPRHHCPVLSVVHCATTATWRFQPRRRALSAAVPSTRIHHSSTLAPRRKLSQFTIHSGSEANTSPDIQ